MDVNQVYQTVLLAVAKNKQDGYVSPDDFYFYINQAQRSYLDYIMGEYQKYQVRRPISVVEIGENQRIRTTIAPLIYQALMSVNPSTGLADYPSDYEYVDAMWGSDTSTSYNIRFVQQDRLDSYLHSTIDPIAVNPVYLIQHEGFHYYPPDIGAARMSYVRTPPSIVWGSVNDSNGIPVWNPATSQDPIWSETDMLQIIVRALALIGVNLQFGIVSQYAESIKQGGQ